MNILLLILFLAAVVLAYLEDYIPKRQRQLILVLFGIFMITVAATKDIYHTADGETYQRMFYDNDDEIIELTTEPSYIYLSRALIAVGAPFAVIFLIYALITIPLKLYTLEKYTPFVFTALVIYIPVYYELHDLVQIRASAAAAFLLCSLKPIIDRRYLLAFGLMLVAVFFHYSSIIYFPMILLGNRGLNKYARIACGLAIPLGFVMYMANMGLLSLIPSSLTGGKLDYYSNSAEIGLWDDMIVPYKNIFLMCKILLLYIMLIFYGKIKEQSRYLPITIVLNAASIFIYLTMATVPTVATRMSDMYAIIDPILFSYLLYVIKPNYITKSGIVVIGAYMLVYHWVAESYFT